MATLPTHTELYAELLQMTDRQRLVIRELILINGGEQMIGILKGIRITKELDAHRSDTP